MDKETKSGIKIGAIALVVVTLIFTTIYFMQSGKKGESHSHGNGAAHSH